MLNPSQIKSIKNTDKFSEIILGNRELNTFYSISKENLFPQKSTKTLEISSNDILTLGSSPIELLPAINSNQYYDFEIDFIYLGGSSGYVSNNVVIKHGETNFALINPSSFGKNVTWGITLKGYNPSTVVTGVPLITGTSTHMGSPVTLTTSSLTDPTGGTGTFKLIITYTIKTIN